MRYAALYRILKRGRRCICRDRKASTSIGQIHEIVADVNEIVDVVSREMLKFRDNHGIY